MANVETLSSRIAIGAFYGDRDVPSLDTLLPPKSNNHRWLDLAAKYAVNPDRFAADVLRLFADEKAFHMHAEQGSALPYFELYGRALCSILRTSRRRSDVVLLAAAEWAQTWLRFCSTCAIGFKVESPGCRIGGTVSDARDAFYRSLLTGEPPAARRVPLDGPNGYPQAEAMLADLMRGERVIGILTPGDWPRLMFAMHVERYERGYRAWCPDLGEKSKPHCYGFPVWGVAKDSSGRRELVWWGDHAPARTGQGDSGERGAKAWGQRSRLMEDWGTLPAWDMGELLESYVLDKDGRREADGSEPVTPPPVEPPRPPKPPKNDPPVDPGATVPRWIRANHDPVPDVELRPNQCAECYLGHAQHGIYAVEGASKSVRPGRVPRRAEGDKNRNPPNAWKMNALGVRRRTRPGKGRPPRRGTDGLRGGK